MSKHKRHPPGEEIQRGNGGGIHIHGQEPFFVEGENSGHPHWVLCAGVEDFRHHAPGCDGKTLPGVDARYLMGRNDQLGVFEPRSAACYAAHVKWQKARP
jgi:hypothetical protein